MFQHFSFMSEINRRQFDFFATYIIPYIQLCPVTNRECTNIFSFMNFTIVYIPYLWSLKFGVPLTKLISNRKYSFFGSCFFFVSSCSADKCIKFELFNNIKQRIGLQGIAAGKLSLLFGKIFLFNGIFYFANDQFLPNFIYQFISKI